MSSHLLDTASIGSGSRYAIEKQEDSLAASIDELAGLRFSIILTAKWETSESVDAERRNELHAELLDLRRQYSQKIDEIAMTFGVQSAMNAKEEVEHSVAVPLGMDTSITPNQDDFHNF
ncbi:MAG: hypothetical protein WAM85_17755 [Terracidiphilus sp.]